MSGLDSTGKFDIPVAMVLGLAIDMGSAKVAANYQFGEGSAWWARRLQSCRALHGANREGQIHTDQTDLVASRVVRQVWVPDTKNTSLKTR